VSITGDFARLSRLVRGLGDTSKLKAELGGSLTEGLSAAYAEQFSRGTSSTGAAWPSPKRGGRPLVRSGALSVPRVRAYVGRGGSLAEGRIAPGPRYARFYSEGPRRILPQNESELGTFGAAVERDVPPAIRRWLEGLV
jgi:hypothetical protein